MAADLSLHTVLAVDQDRTALARLARAIARLGYRPVTTSNTREVIPLLEREQAEVLVLELDTPHLNGIELAALARRAFPQVVRVVVTGAATLDFTVRAINEGEVFRFLRKPWKSVELREALAAALRHREGLRVASDAELLATRREQMLAELEKEHPGITRIPEDTERVSLDCRATGETLRKLLRAGWLKLLS